jgi:hypothetical protein
MEGRSRARSAKADREDWSKGSGVLFGQGGAGTEAGPEGSRRTDQGLFEAAGGADGHQPPRPAIPEIRETEFIVRRLDDSTYPDSDPSPGISGWFKLEIFDFYFNGIEGILNIEYVLMSDQTGDWSPLTSDQSEESFPGRFHRVKVFKIGKIPWRNIRHYDLRGDEYYPFPHLYCLYADNGMPYEGFRYYAISEDDSYHFALRAEAQIELAELLKASSAR